MAIINRDPRELNVEVYLSAIGMTNITAESGNYAFISALADPQNARPLNFDYSYNEDRPFARSGIGLSETRLGRKVKFLPALQSANIVEVATHPSASSCTFAYGGIWQAEKHPTFDLLYGPTIEEYQIPKIKYGIDFPVQSSEITGLKPPLTDDSITDSKSVKAFIPFIRYSTGPYDWKLATLSAYSRERTSYNIWHIIPDGDSPTNLTIKYEGPSISNIVDPAIRTIRDGLNGSSVYVNTKNKRKKAQIIRIFPTSKDSIFYDPENVGTYLFSNRPAHIFYPTLFSLSKAATGTSYRLAYDFDSIYAQAADNLGFHIKIDNLDAAAFDSKIVLKYDSPAVNEKIYRLEIEFINNQIPKVSITFKTDTDGEQVKTFKQLRAPIFGNQNYYDIFIHFAGPNLLIGFENDYSNWNTIYSYDFKRSSDGTTTEKGLEFLFQKNQSYVSMDCTNVNFSFKYSTIIFDNYTAYSDNGLSESFSFNKWLKGNFDFSSFYEWKNITWKYAFDPLDLQAGLALSSLVVKNHLLMSFKTRAEDLTKSSVTPDELLKNLIDNKFMSLSYPDKFNTTATKSGGTSVFGDWRNTNIENRLNSVYTFSEFRRSGTGDTSVFRYKELATKETAGSNIFETFGKLIFNGTIEGPVFVGLRNLVGGLEYKQPGEDEDVPFLHKILKGDISSYVNGDISVTVKSNDNPNASYVYKEATIPLANLDFNPGNTNIGLRLLELIENNVIVVTVRAGYGNLKTYFQGVITGVNTTRTDNGSQIELSCEDLSKYLLENVFFEGYTPFTSYTFKDCFRAIMKVAGYYEFFKVENEYSISNINDILSPNPAENQQILLATRYDRILERINQFLSKMVKIPTVGAGATIGQPTFRWEKGKGFILDARWAPVHTDILKFTGIEPDLNYINSTPNSRVTDPGWHGLLSGGFTINTNTSPLAARIETFGNTLLDGYISDVTDSTFEDNRLSSQKLNDVINSLQNNATVPQGYVGFRKTVQDNLEANEIFNEDLLKFKHEQNVNICTFPFHTLSFNCYVTEPLNHHGTFVIRHFLSNPNRDKNDYVATDKYIYQQCSYNISKSNNLITAQISGVRQPWTIRELEIRNTSK